MKKVFFPLFFSITIGVYSQVVQSDLVFANKESPVDVRIKKNNTFTAGIIINISAKILRDFMDMFDNPTDVHWFVDEKKVTAYFICDSENVTVRYKTNGHLISVRKTYEGNKLEPLVSDFLSREVEKGFIINLVTEVIMGDNTIYEISLQDEKHWCFLQVFQNSEREILEIIDKRIFKKG